MRAQKDISRPENDPSRIARNPDRVKDEAIFHNAIFQAGTRKQLDGFYVLWGPINAQFDRFLSAIAPGDRKILEYGCGLGSRSLQLAAQGADIVGIDISDFAIRSVHQRAHEMKARASFLVMNAEQLAFRDRSFDIVCGTAILHHLDLERALADIDRILKPGGRIAFIEPLGKNPLINIYRRLTPNLRSQDEHPLRQEDLSRLHRMFKTEITYYNFFTLAALPFRRCRYFHGLYCLLDRLDRWAMRQCPTLRGFCWVAFINGEKK